MLLIVFNKKFHEAFLNIYIYNWNCFRKFNYEKCYVLQVPWQQMIN